MILLTLLAPGVAEARCAPAWDDLWRGFAAGSPATAAQACLDACQADDVLRADCLVVAGRLEEAAAVYETLPDDPDGVGPVRRALAGHGSKGADGGRNELEGLQSGGAATRTRLLAGAILHHAFGAPWPSPEPAAPGERISGCAPEDLTLLRAGAIFKNALVAAKQGRHAEAAADFESVTDSDMPGLAWLHAIRSWHRAGRLDKVRHGCEELLGRHPDTDETARFDGPHPHVSCVVWAASSLPLRLDGWAAD